MGYNRRCGGGVEERRVKKDGGARLARGSALKRRQCSSSISTSARFQGSTGGCETKRLSSLP